MRDERGSSWDDGRDRQRHQHPAIDHGQNVVHGQQWAGEYDEQAGYEQPGYEQPGYYDQQGYGYSQQQGGYADPGYYDQQAYGYPPGQGYADGQGYAEPGYGPPGQAYDPRYEQGGYDPRYDQGGGYDPRYEQGYYDDGYGPQYAEPQEYQTGSFIEQGFGDFGVDDRRARRVDDTGGQSRTTGRNRRVADEPPPRRGKEKKKRRRGRSPVVLFIVLLMLGGVAFGAYYGYGKFKDYFNTPDYTGEGSGSAVVHIQGSGSAIAQTLFKAGVVKSAKAFVSAASNDPGSQKIQAGWYKLQLKMSAKSALEWLEAVDSHGTPTHLYVIKVTIKEGELSIDIYNDLAKASGKPVQDFIDAAKDPFALGVDHAWFDTPRDDGRPMVTNNEKGFKYPAMIEGFLFPATYSFDPDATPKTMLSKMVQKFNEVTGPSGLNFMAIAKSTTHLPPYEALIAASIAQMEASTAADMAGVTEVLYNRIYRTTDAGKALGLDSEVNYFLRMTGHDAKTSDQLKASEINNPNDPYRTHGVGGFPPGAISNPGEDALRAAIAPDKSRRQDAWFQTLPGSPAVVFAATHAEFCQQNHQC